MMKDGRHMLVLSEDAIAKIVAAYAARQDTSIDQIVDLLDRLRRLVPYEYMKGKTISQPAQLPVNNAYPAVAVEEAVTRDKVYCLCCGKGYAMLKRHLGAEHGLSEEEYREMFSLPAEFPLVAPSYSERRAAHAKNIGLGKYDRLIVKSRPHQV